MNLRVSLTAIGISVLLAGCTVGPKYAKPSVPVAPAYSEQPPVNFQETNGWKSAQPNDGALRSDWWIIFGDSDLNALEEQVGAANQSLKAAEANYRAAREQIHINNSNLYPSVSTGPAITTNRISGKSPTGLQGYQYGLFDLPISASWDTDFGAASGGPSLPPGSRHRHPRRISKTRNCSSRPILLSTISKRVRWMPRKRFWTTT